MPITVQMKGLDALLAKLEGIKYETRYKGGRFALRKAAQLVRNKARQNAQMLNDPETGRSIASNIVERWNGRVYKSTGNLAFRIGVQGGAIVPKKGEKPDESAGGPTPHWRLLEFGTQKMAAKPFLVPALASSLEAVTSEFIVQYGKGLDRALKRGSKR